MRVFLFFYGEVGRIYFYDAEGSGVPLHQSKAMVNNVDSPGIKEPIMNHIGNPESRSLAQYNGVSSSNDNI